MKNRLIFLLKHIKNRRTNASITPSSKYLAKQMIKDIDFSKIDSIIELGPGTGIFTQYLIKKIKKGTKIIVIEIQKDYIKILQENFGNKIILENNNVKNIEEIRKKHNIEKIDLIMSGLPFQAAEIIKKEIKTYTNQGTIFRSFTYQPKIFKKLYKGFPIKKVGFTFFNIPPARVYGIN